MTPYPAFVSHNTRRVSRAVYAMLTIVLAGAAVFDLAKHGTGYRALGYGLRARDGHQRS